MRYRTRARLITLAVLTTASGVALAWWYPSWRTSRDLRSAEQSLAAYDFPGARELLARCEARRPNDPEIQLLACRAARRAGDLTAAEQHYARYRQLMEGSQPDALLERALIDAQSGRVDEVRPYLLTCLEIKHPRSEEILEALSVGSIGLYNFEQAQVWIEELLARAPANPIGRLNKAKAFATLGRMDEAIAMLRDLVRDYPQNLEAKLSLAPLLATTNANEEAVKVFTDAHRLAPNEPRALAGLARVLLRNNRLDDFRALAPELEQHDDDSQALLYLGRFAVLERRWADGERYLNRAVQLAPYDMEIHRDLSVCLYQIGRREDADQHAKRSREIEADLVQLEKQSTLSTMKPRDPEPRLEAARICLRNGDKSECLRWLRGALDIAPNYKPTHQALADYYAANGNPDLAAHHRALAK